MGQNAVSDPLTELKSMGYDRDFGKWYDLQGLAAAVSDGMPRYNSARLAGMLAEHTSSGCRYWTQIISTCILNFERANKAKYHQSIKIHQNPYDCE